MKSCSAPYAVRALQRGKTKASYLINSRERPRIKSTTSTGFPFYLSQPLKNTNSLESVDKRRHVAWLKLIFCPSCLACCSIMWNGRRLSSISPSSSWGRLRLCDCHLHCDSDVNNITRVSTLAFPRLLFDRFSTVCVCFDAMDFFSFVSYLTESSMDSAWGLLRDLESETDMRSTHESSLAFLRSRPKIYKILSLEKVYYTFWICSRIRLCSNLL